MRTLYKVNHTNMNETSHYRVAYRVGIFWSVSVGISRYLPYRSRSVFLVNTLAEPLKKLAGAPFFLRRGGLGPLFEPLLHVVVKIQVTGEAKASHTLDKLKIYGDHRFRPLEVPM
jgi:hypothetical protein